MILTREVIEAEWNVIVQSAELCTLGVITRISAWSLGLIIWKWQNRRESCFHFSVAGDGELPGKGSSQDRFIPLGMGEGGSCVPAQVWPQPGALQTSPPLKDSNGKGQGKALEGAELICPERGRLGWCRRSKPWPKKTWVQWEKGE